MEKFKLKHQPLAPPEGGRFQWLPPTTKDFSTLGLADTMARLPALIKQGYALSWRADPKATVAITICQILAGALQALGLLATTSTISGLLSSGSISENIRSSLPSLIVLGVALGTNASLLIAVKAMNERIEPTIYQLVRGQLMDSMSEAELAAYDEPGFYDRWDSASVGTKVGSYLPSEVQQVISEMAAFLAAAITLGIVHPLLVPVILVAMAPRAWAAIRVARIGYIASNSTRAQRRYSDMLNNRVADKYWADQVRSGTMSALLLGRYTWASGEVAAAKIRAAWASAKVSATGGLLAGVATCGVWAVLGWLLSTGRLSLAAAGTSVLALRNASSALTALVGNATRVYETGMYYDDWRVFVEEAADHKMQRGTSPCPEAETFSAKGVSYTYPGSEKPALEGVDLEFRRGQVIALVGENGSGKTTLAKLFAGLYLPTTGSILWGDKPTQEIEPESLWSRLAHVPQYYARWPLTAEENVTLGQPLPEGHEAAFSAALRLSGADEVIDRLPSGRETLLASSWFGGKDLSGGQWQRIAISRSFYPDSIMMLMDEPTSALDPRAERRIFDNLRGLAKDRTVLVVTHRITNITDADMIVVMDQGRVVSTGTFEQVLEGCPLFSKMWEVQSRHTTAGE